MKGLSLNPESYPYAKGSSKDSVGQRLGILGHSVLGRHIFCWEAKGEALAFFRGEIENDVITCLEEQGAVFKNTAHSLSITLHMVGKKAKQTAPCVMLLSEDKKARKEAFELVLNSNIMKKNPYFELGHANFDIIMPHAGEAVLKFSALRNENDDSECYLLTAPPLSDLELPGRNATVGGAICSNGKYLIYTASHFLNDKSPIVLPTHKAEANQMEDEDDDDEVSLAFLALGDDYDNCDDDGDDDCDDDDGDTYMEFVETMRQGSLSDLDEISDIGNPDSPKSACDDDGNPHRRSPIISVEESIFAKERPICEAKIVLQDVSLDYALFEADSAFIPQSIINNAIHLDDLSQIEPCARNTTVAAVTPSTGLMYGVLSEITHAYKIHGAIDFPQIYTAKFPRPMTTGDSGTWIRDATTGRLFGHVIGSSMNTGDVKIMPAKLVLEHIMATLDAQHPTLHDKQESIFRALLKRNWEIINAPSDVQFRSPRCGENPKFANTYVCRDSVKSDIDDHPNPFHLLSQYEDYSYRGEYDANYYQTWIIPADKSPGTLKSYDDAHDDNPPSPDEGSLDSSTKSFETLSRVDTVQSCSDRSIDDGDGQGTSSQASSQTSLEDDLPSEIPSHLCDSEGTDEL